MNTIVKFLLLASLLTLGACAASDTQVQSYHESVQSTNVMVIETVQAQAHQNAQRRMDSMVYFSKAMTEAAKTTDPSDNATIAFAWGFVTAQPDTIETPSVKYPIPPVTDVDRVKAWTPIVGMAVPFLQPLVYGWTSDAYGGSSGQDIVATDNATVMIDAGNAGSYNRASGGAVQDNSGAQVTNQHDDYVGSSGTATTEAGVGAEGCPSGYSYRESNGTCITLECEAWIDGGRVGDMPASCDAEVSPGPVSTQPVGGPLCTEEEGGYFYANGITYTDSSRSCSCASRKAGDC